MKKCGQLAQTFFQLKTNLGVGCVYSEQMFHLVKCFGGKVYAQLYIHAHHVNIRTRKGCDQEW